MREPVNGRAAPACPVRVGGRITFAQAAARFRVPEPDVRRADRAVRTRLALGPGRSR